MELKKSHPDGSFAQIMFEEISETRSDLFMSKDILMNTARRMYEQVQYIYKEGEIYFLSYNL